MNQSNSWFQAGISKGWIGTYEQEMIRFMEKEYGELSPDEKLCAVFTSLFLKTGHVCLPLDQSPQEWASILELDEQAVSLLKDIEPDHSLYSESKIIGKPGDRKPLIYDGNNISFYRYRQYETELLEWIEKKGRLPLETGTGTDPKEILNSLFPDESEEPNWQKIAVALSLIKPFLIISGGPGTGKTTTVARILALHRKMSGRKLRVALAAPTGKAAGRMGEALYRELNMMNLSEEELSDFPREAKTIHRLLYGIEERGLLPPAEKSLLRYDLVIIDEASMIDLTLMHRLITHLGEDTRLILLGDRDQLASVEAGSVFADLCQKEDNRFSSETLRYLEEMANESAIPLLEDSGLNDSIVYLTKSYRFTKESGIGSWRYSWSSRSSLVSICTM
jgi:exodeoxyribonuclease V alpha subunit